MLTKKVSGCSYAQIRLFVKGVYCTNPAREDKGEYEFCMSTGKNEETGKVYSNRGLMRHCQYRTKSVS